MHRELPTNRTPPTKRRVGKKSDLAGPPKATPPCTECGKRFSSWKALFGHMRCHPERQWRGINPPPHSPRDHFTDDEYQVAAALLLLANGPPLANSSIEIDASVTFSPSFHFSIRRTEGSVKSSQDVPLPDLNMPPPMDGGEGGISPVLELKLGI